MSLDHDHVRQPQASPKHSAPPALTHTDEALVNQGGPFDPSLPRTAADILGLQRTIGNQATQHLLTGSNQPRLRQSAPNALAEITETDVMYDEIAHGMAYNPKSDGKLRRQWGFEEELKDEDQHDDPETGFFVALIRPTPAGEQKKRHPVLMFRGSANRQAWTKSNSDGTAVGYDSFQANKDMVGDLLKRAKGKVDVVGHSLGGAFAQHAAVTFPHLINQVVTFQAPGVTADQAKQFANTKNRPSVRHHIAEGDLVDLAGEAHLAGPVYKHSPRSLNKHGTYLLSAPEYSHYHKSLNFIHPEKIAMNRPPVRYEQYPHQDFRKVTEAVRKEVGPPLGWTVEKGVEAVRDLRNLPGSAMGGLRDLIIEDLCAPYRNNPIDSESICPVGPRDNR
jgi:hypothetical protein